jgi:N-acyl-L-homoserine lactone synthetase
MPATQPRSDVSLARVDALATEVLAHSAPLRVDIARGHAERDAVYRMRYETVVEQGWARPEDYPDGLERDEYDAEAVHIVAWRGVTLAGTARMVFPAANRALPLETAYELELEPPGEVVDGGRLVVAPEFRGEPAHKVLACLFARFWLETRARGYARLAAVAPRQVIGFYERVGLEVTVVGDPRWYWGDERYPILLAGSESVFSDVRGGDSG